MNPIIEQAKKECIEAIEACAGTKSIVRKILDGYASLLSEELERRIEGLNGTFWISKIKVKEIIKEVLTQPVER